MSEQWKGVKEQKVASKSDKDPNAGGKISFKCPEQGSKVVPWKGAGKVGTAVKADHTAPKLGQNKVRELPLVSEKHYGKS